MVGAADKEQQKSHFKEPWVRVRAGKTVFAIGLRCLEGKDLSHFYK